MPRIYTQIGDAIDYCNKCFPKEDYQAAENTKVNPENLYSYNEMHPDYQDEGYQCETCGKELTSKDN